MDYSQHLSDKNTPQTAPLFNKKHLQTENSAGGFSFKLDPWKRFDRFLMLGTEGGSYYAKERSLTVENAEASIQVIKENGVRAVERILEVSHLGLAPKNDPAIFALALAATHGSAEAKAAAYKAIVSVCRTGTHLFAFCQAIQNLRGWSRGLRSGVAKFYESRQADQMAYQLVKYRQRNGWSHGDVIRLAHPKLKESKARLALKMVGKDIESFPLPPVYAAYESAQKLKAGDGKAAALLVADAKLPWEAIPTELLNERPVWEALVPQIGLNALLRNLSRLSKIGMLTESGMDENSKLVARRFADAEAIAKERLHPITILNGLLAFAKGKSERTSDTWRPSQKICSALEQAYHLAFKSVKPTGKNHMLALDVSGSMSSPEMAGTALTPRMASTAIAMVTQAIEEMTFLMGFSNQFMPLPITRNTSLGDAIHYTASLPFNSTDCALPMVYAKATRIPVDTFVIYTDNETYHGAIHPNVALEDYRQSMGRDAKLIVVGMVSNGFTIADPTDARQLDIVGFGLDVPQVISSFSGA